MSVNSSSHEPMNEIIPVIIPSSRLLAANIFILIVLVEKLLKYCLISV